MDATDGLTDEATLEQERAYAKLLEHLLDQRLEPMVEAHMTKLNQRVDANYMKMDATVIVIRQKLDKLLNRVNDWNTVNIDYELDRMRVELLDLTKAVETLEQSVFPKPEDFSQAVAA